MSKKEIALTELKTSESVYCTAEDIAPILDASPATIRSAARAGTLGFAVSIIGKRVLIPIKQFLEFWGV